ncbi:hypothetical protein WJX75_003848 [Coccomyxa subellipsoidea]|uniref:Uncharacterized protein n=1 Tax=Coccomyxa subellipsoidea TaxID=248742 RepID=A0ABR2YRK1_9CHLO
MGTNGTVYKRPPPRFDNLSKLIIPVLLLGVYALWMHDRSSRVARAASQAQTLALTDIDKPYVHFQQLQSEETSSIETGEGSRARPLDQNRKIVGGRDTVSQAGTLPNISLAALPDGVGKTGAVGDHGTI